MLINWWYHEAMPTRSGHTATEFALVAGHPALDFVNTADRDGDRLVDERLGSFDALMRWVAGAAVAEPEVVERLRRRGATDAGMASAALARAHETRALIHRAFRGSLDGAADPAAVADLDRALQRALARRHLADAGGSLRWHWEPAERELVEILGPLLIGAAELLTRPGEVALLRVCAAPACGWLYLDRSRNGLRRWCEMRTCGSREKSRRQYARRRAGR